MQLANTTTAAPRAAGTETLLPREVVAAQLNLGVQDLFNTLHVNARTAHEQGGAGFHLTPARIVSGIDVAKVSGNFLVLVQAARAVAPEAEADLANAEHAISGLAQLLLSAANDNTTVVDPDQLGQQFLPPFNEELSVLSLAAQRIVAPSAAGTAWS